MSLAFFAAPFESENTNLLQKKREKKIKESFSPNTTLLDKTPFHSEKVNKFIEHLHNNTSSNSDDEEDNYSSPKKEENTIKPSEDNFTTYFAEPPPLPKSIGAERKASALKESFETPVPVSTPKLDDLNNYSLNYHDEQGAENYYKRTLPQYASLQRQKYYNNNNNTNISSGSNEDIFLRKLNYMIHLLEEQQDEKTNNVTEEVVLFSFLGMFMIFLADSFVRIGKYVR